MLVTVGEVEDRGAGAPEDSWVGYDPNAVDEALRETAGSWTDSDPDALVAAIYRAREVRNSAAIEALMPYILDANWPIHARLLRPSYGDRLRRLEPEVLG